MNVIIKFMLFTSIIKTSYELIIVKIFFVKISTLYEPGPAKSGRVLRGGGLILIRNSAEAGPV